MQNIEDLVNKELSKFSIYKLIELYEEKIHSISIEIKNINQNRYLYSQINIISTKKTIESLRSELLELDYKINKKENQISNIKDKISTHFNTVTTNVVEKLNKINYLHNFNKHKIIYLTLNCLNDYIIYTKDGKINEIEVNGYRHKGEDYSSEIQHMINSIKKYNLTDTNKFIIDPNKTNISDYVSNEANIGCIIFFIVCFILLLLYIPISNNEFMDVFFILIPVIGFTVMQIYNIFIYNIILNREYNINYFTLRKRINIIRSVKRELFVSIIISSEHYKSLRNEKDSIEKQLSLTKMLKRNTIDKLNNNEKNLQHANKIIKDKEYLELEHQKYLEIYNKLLEIKINYEQTQKQKQDYWLRMNGHKFEREIAKLFRSLNHEIKVTLTSGSDDGGIDMIIIVNDQSVPVQCKNLAKPVSPGAIRDFQGAITTMKNINKSIFISSNGFSERAYNQASITNTLRLDINHIVKLHNHEKKTINMLLSYLWA